MLNSEFTTKMTLHSPITEKEWALICDAEFETTEEITFITPSGKNVTFYKKQNKGQQWISCSERLPEFKQEIFFTEKNNETGELYVGRGQFWGVTARTGSSNSPWSYADTFGADGRRWHVLDSKIVAWLPVPQPWEGE